MGFWSWLKIFRGGAAPDPHPAPTSPVLPVYRPRVRTVAAVIGQNQTPIPGASVIVSAGTWTRSGTTNPDGYLAWPDVPAPAVSVTIAVIAQGYDDYRTETILPDVNVEIRIGFPPGPGFSIRLPDLVPSAKVMALATAGGFFRGVNGEYHTIVEATDFRLLARYLAGEDIVPVLKDRAGLGFNTLRVALSCRQMFDLDPQAIEGYGPRLVRFTNLLLAYALRPEYVLFMDATRVFPDNGSRRVFAGMVCESLLDLAPLVLLELVNENDQPINHMDTSWFAPPAAFLWSRGSNGSQAVPVRPPGRYETFHSNDAPEWWRKVGHNAMELSEGGPGFKGSGVPVLSNENTRAPDRFNNPDQAFDAAAAAALLCAGSCFHFVSGKDSVVMTDEERVLADAWVRGAQSVDLRFQDGQYRHAGELEGPRFLRVYQRVLPGGEASTVRIRK